MNPDERGRCPSEELPRKLARCPFELMRIPTYPMSALEGVVLCLSLGGIGEEDDGEQG